MTRVSTETCMNSIRETLDKKSLIFHGPHYIGRGTVRPVVVEFIKGLERREDMHEQVSD